MSDKPVLRAYGQYLLGVSMVFMRVAGGNTTYFLGQVSNQAWWYYFPVALVLKSTPSLVILAFLGGWPAWKRPALFMQPVAQ